jgi:hypothetical protein
MTAGGQASASPSSASWSSMICRLPAAGGSPAEADHRARGPSVESACDTPGQLVPRRDAAGAQSAQPVRNLPNLLAGRKARPCCPEPVALSLSSKSFGRSRLAAFFAARPAAAIRPPRSARPDQPAPIRLDGSDSHSDRYGSFKRLSLRLRCLSVSPVVQYSLRAARSASS